MKALDLLKAIDRGYAPKYYISISEAIEELEAIQAPKTCGTCKYFLPHSHATDVGSCESNNQQTPWCTVSSFGCIYYEPKDKR